MDLSQEYVRSLLDYEPDTGLFRWKINRPPRGKAGAIAGHDNGAGYVIISIHGARRYAHRLAFLWMEGQFPDIVDHINGCRWDNRWSNLRSVDHVTNMANIVGRSGIRHRYGRWYARYAGFHLGSFATEAEAAAARLGAEIVLAKLNPRKRQESPVERMRPKSVAQ